jgi:hypothetical protein
MAALPRLRDELDDILGRIRLTTRQPRPRAPRGHRRGAEKLPGRRTSVSPVGLTDPTSCRSGDYRCKLNALVADENRGPSDQLATSYRAFLQNEHRVRRTAFLSDPGFAPKHAIALSAAVSATFRSIRLRSRSAVRGSFHSCGVRGQGPDLRPLPVAPRRLVRLPLAVAGLLRV